MATVSSTDRVREAASAAGLSIEIVEMPASEWFEQQRNQSLRSLLTAFLGLAVTWAFQTICGTFVFYTHLKRQRWLRWRYWYALYDYNLMFFNCALGLGMYIFRIITWFVLGIGLIGRLDLCLVPNASGIEKWDNPWHTYVALMMQDHQYNNPVNAVFFQILTHELTRSRRNRALYATRAANQSACLPPSLCGHASRTRWWPCL